MSDNLDLIQIEKFKNSVSVSDDQCLQYVRKQCVSSEDIIFTVLHRIRLFAMFAWIKARTPITRAMLQLCLLSFGCVVKSDRRKGV